MRFKIGDKVKRNYKTEDYIFTVVAMDDDGEMTIYCKEWSNNGEGHGGQIVRDHGHGMKDDRGHWNVDESDVIPIAETPGGYKFKIGDVVEYIDKVFTIVGFHDCTGSPIIFSEDWSSRGKGHNGKNGLYKGNGHSSGHWYANVDNIKLINSTINNEVSRQNSRECPGGIESKIHSQPIQIASCSRPIGSRTTACRIGIQVGRGSLSNNWIQSN